MDHLKGAHCMSSKEMMERLGDDRNLRGSNHGTEMQREAPQSQVDLGATPTYEIELIGKEGSMKERAKKKASKNGKGEEPSAQTSQWSEDGWDWPQHSNQKSNQWSQNPQDSGEQADSSWTRCDEEIGWTRSNVSDGDMWRNYNGKGYWKEQKTWDSEWSQAGNLASDWGQVWVKYHLTGTAPRKGSATHTKSRGEEKHILAKTKLNGHGKTQAGATSRRRG